MTDILIQTDNLIHNCLTIGSPNGELVFVTIGKFKHCICKNCGKVTTKKV